MKGHDKLETIIAAATHAASRSWVECAYNTSMACLGQLTPAAQEHVDSNEFQQPILDMREELPL